MKAIVNRPSHMKARLIAVFCLVVLAVSFVLATYVQAAAQPTPSDGQRLLTVHDRGRNYGILTNAVTIRAALAEAGIHLDPNDTVEPGLDHPLTATSYEVNVYRARPVTIIDGTTREKVMSPHRTANQIVEQAGIKLQKEDITTMTANTDMVSQGAGVQLTIDRATPLTLMLYGVKTTVYTHKTTVADLLAEKEIILAKNDVVSMPLSTKVTKGMTIELWRNGVQTITVKEAVDFEIEKVYDADQPIGYRKVKTPGVEGRRTVTYEIRAQDGKELSRKKIQSVTTKEPKKQVEIIGAKPPAGGLTKAKGAHYFTDSRGVVHRETYYDLPMNVVMRACGGGTYSVRADGAKIDQDGYVLVAANLSRYPRCSVVETSLGPGKVYDTGGFATVHPDGFDLATDWTKNDGI